MQKQITLSGPLVLQPVVRREGKVNFQDVEWKYLGWWLISWCIRTRTHQSYKHYSHNSTWVSLGWTVTEKQSQHSPLRFRRLWWWKPGPVCAGIDSNSLPCPECSECVPGRKFKTISNWFDNISNISKLTIHLQIANRSQAIWCSADQHCEPPSQATHRRESRESGNLPKPKWVER